MNHDVWEAGQGRWSGCLWRYFGPQLPSGLAELLSTLFERHLRWLAVWAEGGRALWGERPRAPWTAVSGGTVGRH